MKFSFVGPGIMPIPPNGWGAIEILIWDYKISLEKLGHEVQIVNTPDLNDALAQINNFHPDFVHIQYDDYVYLYPHVKYPCAVTTHFAYLERQDMMGPYKERVFDAFKQIKPIVFGLSDRINDVYNQLCKIPKTNLFLNPNGVNLRNFKCTQTPKFFDKSIYLATIDHRKRQFLFQDIDSLWYAGNVRDPRFNKEKNYLGEWNKDYLYNNLTDYGNLVLLSDGEAHPLVCMEALAAGLGVVVCEWGTANLNIDSEFITVISEERINDIDFVENAIIKNRQYSISHRNEIFEYSKQFDWINIIQKYYLQNVNQIIYNYKSKNTFTNSKVSVGIF